MGERERKNRFLLFMDVGIPEERGELKKKESISMIYKGANSEVLKTKTKRIILQV